MYLIKRFIDFINESKNYQNLYHILDYDKLNFMFTTNSIKSFNFPNISLTRNKMMNSYLGASPVSIFKIEIDAKKLSNKYKIEPFSFKTVYGERFKEYEEQVKTNKITNIFYYINKIILIKNEVQKLKINRRDESDISDWFSDSNENNLPKMINDIFIKCKEKGFDLYVQDNNIIKKDDLYINSIINHPLHKINYVYASVLKGEKFFKNKNSKYGIYKDILIDNNKNILDDLYLGKEYFYNEIPFKLYPNKNIEKLSSKIILNKEFTPYLMVLRKLNNGNLYFEDLIKI